MFFNRQHLTKHLTLAAQVDGGHSKQDNRNLLRHVTGQPPLCTAIPTHSLDMLLPTIRSPLCTPFRLTLFVDSK